MTDTIETPAPAPKKRTFATTAAEIALRWGRLCGVAAFLAFVVSEVAGGRFPGVLITPYTPQWTAVAFIGLALVGVAGRRVTRRVDVPIMVAAGLAAMYGALVTTHSVPWRTVPPAVVVSPGDPDAGRVKVFAANVHTSNRDHKTVLNVIADENPDVIFLSEVDDRWAVDLKALDARYPNHTVFTDSEGNFGAGFWSRLPGDAEWTTMKPPDFNAGDDTPQIDATLQLPTPGGPARSFRFIGLHPLTPMKPTKQKARDAVLNAVADRLVAAKGVPAIVAGDFNATRYCRITHKFAAHAGLRDAAAPLKFSWPNTWSWWAMGIRIDQALVTDDWHVLDVHTGRDIGSDHLPVVVTLQWAVASTTSAATSP